MNGKATFTWEQRKMWHLLLEDADFELKVKAQTALVLSDTPQEVIEWLMECEDGHIPGDCLLCGAE